MVLGGKFYCFWNDIIRKIADNYEKIHYKEVYEYLKNIDLEKAKKRAIFNHYKRDYKEIIKRKIFKK